MNYSEDVMRRALRAWQDAAGLRVEKPVEHADAEQTEKRATQTKASREKTSKNFSSLPAMQREEQKIFSAQGDAEFFAPIITDEILSAEEREKTDAQTAENMRRLPAQPMEEIRTEHEAAASPQTAEMSGGNITPDTLSRRVERDARRYDTVLRLFE